MIMRLSTAIALGRSLKQPRAYTLGIGEGSGCALGMGLAAVDEHSSWAEQWPWLRQACDLPCGCEGFISTFAGAITHLFDLHVYETKDWNLDQLIDWVRSVEPAEEGEISDSRIAKEESVCVK